MNAILRLWMDVILVLTFQHGIRRRVDGSGGQVNRPSNEASRYNERSGRSADW
jgi:hypothetical protein